jgi:hypothetical protein
MVRRPTINEDDGGSELLLDPVHVFSEKGRKSFLAAMFP